MPSIKGILNKYQFQINTNFKSIIGNLKFEIRNWKFPKIYVLATIYLLLATVLSGCNAVGTNKPAALQVTSTPEAAIFLDGKHLGKTPFYSDQLKKGDYLLKITASEAAYVEKITLSEGTLTVVNRQLANNFLLQSGETLRLEQSRKGLFLISNPAASQIVIDGRDRGQTPALIFDLEEGEHKVTLSKNGYQDREFAIKTSGKYQLVADITLASQIAKNTTSSTKPTVTIEKVEILSTPLGFLRVRKEPSLTSSEIGRVKTNDQFEVLQETEGWIKIKFEGKDGWIASDYTKKLPP